MSKLVSLNAVREIRKIQTQDPDYKNRILKMDKVELLHEMMLFQKERSKLGYLTIQMMIHGQILFQALEENAETEDLRLLASSYRKHLKCELNNRTQTEIA